MEDKKSEATAKTRKPYVKPTIRKTRKPYEKATLNKLTPEQAKIKLIEAVKMGDQGAKELLEIMFPDEFPKDSTTKKRSA